MSKEVDPRITDRCRKCPVLARYTLLEDISKATDKKFVGESLKHLDEAEVTKTETQQGVLRDIGKFTGEVANEAFVRAEGFRRQGNYLLSFVGTDCPGPTRGSGESGIFGVLDYLTGERSCHNPGFAVLQNDPEINIQLREGNWSISE